MHFLKKLGWLTSPKLSSLAACECTSAFKWFRQSSDAQRCLLRSITRQTKTFPRKLARKSSYTTFRLLLESHNLPQKKKKTMPPAMHVQWLWTSHLTKAAQHVMFSMTSKCRQLMHSDTGVHHRHVQNNVHTFRVPAGGKVSPMRWTHSKWMSEVAGIALEKEPEREWAQN